MAAKDWQTLAGPPEHYWQCGVCSACLDVLDDGRLRLHLVTSDPYGVGHHFLGKLLPRARWTRLALGLPLTAGNCFCPGCLAEFDHDTANGTLELLGLGSGDARWDTWRGRPYPLEVWALASAGKRSPRPGWLCTACDAEFDDEPAGLKAVRLPAGPLSGLVNLVYSLDDWHRRAAGVPTSVEEQQLREELARLLAARQDEQNEPLRAHRQRLAALEGELTRLLRQGIVEGCYTLRLQSGDVTVPEDEALHWEGAGTKLKQRSSQGVTYWESECDGTVFVTSKRVLFASRDVFWHRPLSKVLRVDQQSAREGPVAALWLDGLQKPVGIRVSAQPFSMKVGGQTRTIKLGTEDLVRLIQNLLKK
jgi:hypothetical protein